MLTYLASCGSTTRDNKPPNGLRSTKYVVLLALSFSRVALMIPAYVQQCPAPSQAYNSHPTSRQETTSSATKSSLSISLSISPHHSAVRSSIPPVCGSRLAHRALESLTLRGVRCQCTIHLPGSPVASFVNGGTSTPVNATTTASSTATATQTGGATGTSTTSKGKMCKLKKGKSSSSSVVPSACAAAASAITTDMYPDTSAGSCANLRSAAASNTPLVMIPHDMHARDYDYYLDPALCCIHTQSFILREVHSSSSSKVTET
ncbi:uncharacterized protein LACBIDRAFT_332923 [Laccaria bicolor S238N-H82]|uniref:Predicted protein n=1 Tax=Laccaria bicolor (strain S238N-H82 / ATCC MYA-4686) TaxID=486041 RepID=B0DU99_LACBS|nr:uncharacterized protein LACBIDRAFT_332923 [Laccaria bicolor S238N-H82]EDR01867.1 predicted protein [Laccaria bicolor S238N-H82]|eukprot:XP_001887477.1 predicted protein [Laccaria bicolor S238N-H82]